MSRVIFSKPFFGFFRWLSHPIHPSWLLYASFCGFILGLSLCLATNTFWVTSPLWLIAAFLAILLSILIPHRYLLALALLAGTLLGNFRIAPELSSKAYFAQLTGSEITITGQISEDPDLSEGKVVLRLSNLRLKNSNSSNSSSNLSNPPNPSSNSSNPPGSSLENDSLALSGTLYAQLSGRQTDFLRSDVVTLRGKLNAGFGTFAAVMYRPEVTAIERATPGDIFATIKQNFATAVRTYLPSPEVDLGLGYLMGMKNGLSEDFANTLRLVGMTHVVVASGAHLGIIIGFVKKLFGRLSRFAELLFSLLMITAFVLIVGFTASMTRAALVTSLSLLVGYVGRKFTPLRLLLLVAAITLALNPLFLLNLGWQLSFASFFGLLVVLPRLQRQFYGGKSPPWLASMLLTSLATSLVCAPILVYSYGVISLLSFVANLIILPTLPYVMLLVFLTGVTSFFPPVATLFAHLAKLLLDLHIFVVNYLSEQTMFIFNLPTGDLKIFSIYLFLALYLIFPTCLRHFRQNYAIIKSRCKLILRLR